MSMFKRLISGIVGLAARLDFGGKAKVELDRPPEPKTKAAYVQPVHHAYRNKHRAKFSEVMRWFLAGKQKWAPHPLYNLAERYRQRYSHMLTTTVTEVGNAFARNCHDRRRRTEARTNPLGRPNKPIKRLTSRQRRRQLAAA